MMPNMALEQSAGSLAFALPRLLTAGVSPHDWQDGDLIIWDNRCVLHRAMPYDTARYKRPHAADHGVGRGRRGGRRARLAARHLGRLSDPVRARRSAPRRRRSRARSMPLTRVMMARARAGGTTGRVRRTYLARTSSGVSGFPRVPRACSTRRVSVRPLLSESSTIES